jgi:hypothetical protein
MEMIDWANFIREQGETQQRMLALGIKIGEERHQYALRTLDAAYQRAVLDPTTRMPSYLMAAIFSLIQKLGESKTVDSIAKSLPSLEEFNKLVESAQNELRR